MSLVRGAGSTEVLKQLTGGNGQRTWPRLRLRLGIRALLEHKVPQRTIGLALGCHVKTISSWEKRFQAGEDVRDRPRSGRPSTIPPEVDHRLVAFFCQQNPLPGCTHWSIRWAHQYIQSHPEILGCSISPSSLHRRLNAHALRPHRTKYFLHISDPEFFPKMESILAVYADPPEYLFCLDECTGLQALERLGPTLPARGQWPAYRECDYKRHGTVSILSILRVSTGKVFTNCIPDHTTLTVLASLREHVCRFANGIQLHYILDNYSSHSTEEMCRAVAELCHIRLPELPTVAERRQWLESTDKRIVFHFLPPHGSWLNLIEIWFTILQQKALKGESFRSALELVERILDFRSTWNTHFAHRFEWSYTGDGLHEKVIARFNTWLRIESSELTPKFLVKQIQLMQNLATNYWPKATPAVWHELAAVLTDSRNFIRGILAEGKQPCQRLLDDLVRLVHHKIETT
jgi:transposase